MMAQEDNKNKRSRDMSDPPGLLMEVVEMVDNPSMSIAQLGKVIASDQSLSARVLRIANSPALAIPRRVSDVNSAITFLGFNTLRDTVIRAFANGVFRRIVRCVALYEEFWNHSITCAVASRTLALRWYPELAEAAFVAGLFHDVGILMSDPESSRDVPFPAAATTAFAGLGSHEEVGALIAERWMLGNQIREAIRWHHTPSLSATAKHLATLVHAADVLSCSLEGGRPSHEPDFGFNARALADIGLSEEDLRIDRIMEEVAAIRRDVAEAPLFESIVAQVKENLMEAMGMMGQNERLVFALLYQEGLTPTDVARMLVMSLPEVERLQRLAVMRLANAVNQIQ